MTHGVDHLGILPDIIEDGKDLAQLSGLKVAPCSSRFTSGLFVASQDGPERKRKQPQLVELTADSFLVL